MTATESSAQEYDTSTPAVVLKFDPNALHHGGLGVIRSLGRRGVPVYAVHESRWSPAAHSRYLRGRWLWHPSIAEEERVVEGLFAISDRIGRRAVLCPTDDMGAIFLAERGAILRERFDFTEPPSSLPRRVAGKYSMHELCHRVGIPHAEAHLVTNSEEAFSFAERVGYPVAAKLATPWCGISSGLPSTSIVHGRDDLAELFRSKVDAESGALMLQEFVPGGRGHDWFFHGYCDGSAHCEPAYTGVKERSYPAHAGLTSLGQCVDNPALRRSATELLRKVKFHGVADLDFRYDARDGRYKLLDFNPRLGAQFRLFTNTAGIDVAFASYLDLTGQGIPSGIPLTGRRFLVENYDPIAAGRYWSQGELGIGDWARSLRGVDETAWFAGDDLLPFALMVGWMGRRAMSRLPIGPGARPAPAPAPIFRTGRSAGAARWTGVCAFTTRRHQVCPAVIETTGASTTVGEDST
ncbi:carboxylate--amine ligase [Parasphingorhabdus pacifica]